jgi:hydroxymethylbilane synthase
LIVIGSRGSQLALWQARWVAARLEGFGEQTRIEIIKTTGDKIADVPLGQVGSKGLFTKEIEDALLDGSVDLAVHSLKDMPTELPPGLVLAAIPEREDVRDALIGRTLADLALGARVGTGSLRRAAQLRALRPDLEVAEIRGNVDTRLRKLDEGQYDAIMLAAAGLARLGWANRISQYFDPEEICPAVGQGALAIETIESKRGIAARLNDSSASAAVRAERALLGALGGGCQVPVGAYARVDGVEVYLRAIVASLDGSRIVRSGLSGSAEAPEELGRRVADELLAQGARELLGAVLGR